MLYVLHCSKTILCLIFKKLLCIYHSNLQFLAGDEADLSLATIIRKFHSSFKFKRGSPESTKGTSELRKDIYEVPVNSGM